MAYESKKFACTHCGQHVEADVSFAGKTFSCPGCQQPMRIPAEHSFRCDAAASSDTTSRRWIIWCAIVLIAGGAAVFLASRMGSEGAGHILGSLPFLPPPPIIVEGESYPQIRKSFTDIYAGLNATMLPPGKPRNVRSDIVIGTTLDVDRKDITQDHFFEASAKCSAADIQRAFGKPSRVAIDKKMQADFPAAPVFSDWHYHFVTAKAEPIHLTIRFEGSEAIRGSIKAPATAEFLPLKFLP